MSERIKEQENQNLEIWNSYKAVPKNAMKSFDNGKFKGTDINTMWRLKSLTEQFGPCGLGWYFNIKRTWVETTPNNEQFAFAEIELFVKYGETWSMPIVGNGGNKLTRVTKNGDYSTSDEAFKMAVTDAIGVACRNLGFGADVYWENDRTKYTDGDNINKQETSKPEFITAEQKRVMKDLGVVFDGVLEMFAIPEIDLLPYEKAEWVINKKRAALKAKEQA